MELPIDWAEVKALATITLGVLLVFCLMIIVGRWRRQEKLLRQNDFYNSATFLVVSALSLVVPKVYDQLTFRVGPLFAMLIVAALFISVLVILFRWIERWLKPSDEIVTSPPWASEFKFMAWFSIAISGGIVAFYGMALAVGYLFPSLGDLPLLVTFYGLAASFVLAFNVPFPLSSKFQVDMSLDAPADAIWDLLMPASRSWPARTEILSLQAAPNKLGQFSARLFEEEICKDCDKPESPATRYHLQDIFIRDVRPAGAVTIEVSPVYLPGLNNQEAKSAIECYELSQRTNGSTLVSLAVEMKRPKLITVLYLKDFRKLALDRLQYLKDCAENVPSVTQSQLVADHIKWLHEEALLCGCKVSRNEIQLVGSA